MRIFNGKKEAEKILSDLKKKIKKERIEPKLAVILVGSNEASKLYIKLKRKKARETGVQLKQHKFKKWNKEEAILQKIEVLNKNRLVNGIIVQLPLPEGFNTGKILSKINPRKDVDGFHKKTLFFSPFISAILIALKKSSRNLKGKKIIALVNSDIFGKTLKNSLNKENIKVKYLIRRELSFQKIKSSLKSADVLITVCGVPNLIKGDMINKGAILIDGGITLIKNKVVGDVDRKSVKNEAAFLTPVPGGLGPLTVALLLKNVYLTAKKYGNS